VRNIRQFISLSTFKFEIMSDTVPVNRIRLASRVGFFLGLILVLQQTVYYLANVDFKSNLNYLNYIILIGGLYLGIKELRDKHYNGFISYGSAVGYGVLVSLFAGIIIACFIFILYSYIDPNLIDKMLVEIENTYIESGALSDDQVDEAVGLMQKMYTPNSLALFSVLGNVFMGLIFSLILGIILRKEDNSFDKDLA